MAITDVLESQSGYDNSVVVRVQAVGDHDIFFPVESACKPVNYCLALEEHGEDEIAAAVAEDLRRVLAGEPIAARRAGVERIWVVEGRARRREAAHALGAERGQGRGVAGVHDGARLLQQGARAAAQRGAERALEAARTGEESPYWARFFDEAQLAEATMILAEVKALDHISAKANPMTSARRSIEVQTMTSFGE